jgi:hypothetical protein
LTTFRHCRESEVAELSSWDQASRGEKLGLVRRKRKKISQIINDYLYLPFFLLIILWYRGRDRETLVKKTGRNQGWKGLKGLRSGEQYKYS